MRKLVIAAIMPVLFFACAKEENTNPAFREPTCADTLDDGIFENYTAPETVEFLRYFRSVPPMPVPNVVRYHYINSRTLYNRGVDYSPYVTFNFKRPAMVFAFVPFPNQPEQYYSWVLNAEDTLQEYKVNLYHLRQHEPKLQPGCYRMYYVVSDSDTGVVFTKGHYDFEIKNQ